MLEQIRGFDWSTVSAGPLDGWPAELKSAARMMLLSASAMGLLIGRDGILIYNDAAREVFGSSFDGSVGRPVGDVFPDARDFYDTILASCYAARGTRFTDEKIRLFRNGVWQPAWFNLGFTPIVDERGEVFGALAVASETTERVRALVDLRRSRERVDLALKAGGIVGVWGFDPETRHFTLEGDMARWLGHRDAGVYAELHADFLLQFIHEDDRQRVTEIFNTAFRSSTDFTCRYRTHTLEGAERWLVLSGRPMPQGVDEREKMAGIVIDVTEQAELQTELRNSNLRFDIVTEAIPQIVWSTDGEGRHDYFNRRWTEFTGIEPSRIEADTWKALVHPDDWAGVQESWDISLRTGKTYHINYRFRHHSGAYRWLKVLAMPLKDEAGRITRWYGTSTDIEADKLLEQERELVSNELNHRIKNIFALVNGLVSITARENPDLLAGVQPLRARLDALRKAHDLIRQSPDGQTRSLRHLIGLLLEPYLVMGDGRLTIEGDDFRLNRRATTSMALVLHELATNSAKYGALSDPASRLVILLRTDGNRLKLQWREEHAVNLSAEAPRGFGSRLLDLTIEGQLQGRVLRTLGPNGMSVTLSLPCQQIEEEAV